jgi:hypothetical protein
VALRWSMAQAAARACDGSRATSPGLGSESAAPCPPVQPLTFGNLALLFTPMTVTRYFAYRLWQPLG